MGSVTASVTDIIIKLPDLLSKAASGGTMGLVAMGVVIVALIIGLIWMDKLKDNARHIEEEQNKIKNQASNAGQSSTVDQSAVKAENRIDDIIKG